MIGNSVPITSKFEKQKSQLVTKMSLLDIPIEVVMDVESLITMCKVSRIYYDQLDENIWNRLLRRDFIGKRMIYSNPKYSGCNRSSYQIFRQISKMSGKFRTNMRITLSIHIKKNINAVVVLKNTDDSIFEMTQWWNGNKSID